MFLERLTIKKNDHPFIITIPWYLPIFNKNVELLDYVYCDDGDLFGYCCRS